MGHFQLIYPDPHTRGGDPHYDEVPIELHKTLRYYFRQRRIIGLRMSCRMILESTRKPLRLTYEPKPGDVIRLIRTSAMA